MWGGTGVRRKANDGARLWYSAHMSREIPVLADPADRERVHARMMSALADPPSSATSPSKHVEPMAAYTRHIRRGTLDIPGEATDELRR